MSLLWLQRALGSLIGVMDMAIIIERKQRKTKSGKINIYYTQRHVDDMTLLQSEEYNDDTAAAQSLLEMIEDTRAIDAFESVFVRDSAQKALKRAGLDELHMRIFNMLQDGWTCKEIARKLRVKYDKVYYAVKKIRAALLR